MKKNNKGFFLAETIVIIALVTTVMAFVYPNVTKLYDNYVNRTKYYDQTEDLYVLKAYEKLFNNDGTLKTATKDPTKGEGCKEFNIGDIANTSAATKLNISGKKIGNIYELYITGYMTDLKSDSNYNLNKYLKRLKKTTYDKSSYRLVGIFKDGSNYKYASIKIDNPNPARNCNLGG